MNSLTTIYARTFQFVMKVGAVFLPFRVPEIFSGENAVEKICDKIKSLGHKRLLLVTDATITKLGLYNQLVEALDKQEIQVFVYDKTVPNPTIENVEQAFLMYKQNSCSGIVGFGGGSSLDCAKVVGARVARPNKSVKQMKGLFKVLRRLPDIFAVPTTAGTGSETTVAAVVVDSETHSKFAINDLPLIPRYALHDPKITVGLPKHITSTTGMDALTHAVEAFIGNSNTKKTEEYAVLATEIIFKNIKTVYDNPSDIEAREKMLLASFYGGAAFTRAYVGNVHAVSHALGGKYSTPHGLANAVALPVVLEYYGESVYQKLALLSDRANLYDKNLTNKQKAEKFISDIKQFNNYLGIPEKLDDIKQEDIKNLAIHAYKEAVPLYPVPKLLDINDVEKIYKLLSN